MRLSLCPPAAQQHGKVENSEAADRQSDLPCGGVAGWPVARAMLPV